MKTYYIYILIDPRDNKVRYVGCTINPKSRLSSHIHQHHNALQGKVDWILDMKSVGVVPAMRVTGICHSIEEVRIKEKEVYDTYNFGQLLCADPGRLKYTARPEKYHMS